VIGIGSGMTSATLLAWPSIERVDTIEIEPRMAEGASLLTDRTRAVFRDPRSHLVFDDAKAWLARAKEHCPNEKLVARAVAEVEPLSR
jgi:spermidine synthase